MRTRRSIISQMLTAFAVFAVLIVIAAVVGYIAVARQNSAARQLTGRDYVLQQNAGHLQEEFTTSQILISSFAISGADAFLRPLPARRVAFDQHIARLRKLAPSRLQGYVTAQQQAGARLQAIGDGLARLPPRSAAATGLATGISGVAEQFYRANQGMQDSLATEVRQLTSDSRDSLVVGLTWSGAALGVAVLLVLAGTLSTLGAVTRPLRALTATVRRLTAGDHAARAPVSGSAEVREVAEAVNRQADESDLLRAQEAEGKRLRAMARAAGIRIREPLTAEAVIEEARAALEHNVDADVVYLQLVADGQVGPPIGHPGEWLLADAFREALPAGEVDRLHGLFRRQTSEVVQDLTSEEESRQLPDWIRAAMLAAGVGTHLLAPFGEGGQMLGFVAADRLGPPRAWSAAEVDAVESIAADLGRGLHHARMYEAENRLVEDLKSLDRAKSDFFATVAHELRAPLTSIEGFVEMLGEQDAGPVTPQQRQMLATIERGAARLRNLIDDVFTLSKLEAEAFATVTRPVDLAEVIAAAAEALRPSVEAGGLTLSVDYPGDGMVVDGDPDQLDRVMVNLLSNAVKFTPEGGHVEVAGATERQWAQVRVSDSGIGVPEKDQPKLFTRFFRASNAVERSIPGTGLGLAIVRTIVANHGGDVRLESREGSGTSITVRLPLLDPAAPDRG